MDLLEEEAQDKVNSEAQYEEERLAIFDRNQAKCMELKDALKKINGN